MDSNSRSEKNKGSYQKFTKKPTKEALALTEEFLANAPKNLRIRTKEQEAEALRNKFITHRLPQNVDPNYYAISDSDDIDADDSARERSGKDEMREGIKERVSVLKKGNNSSWIAEENQERYRKKAVKPLREVNKHFNDIAKGEMKNYMASVMGNEGVSSVLDKRPETREEKVYKRKLSKGKAFENDFTKSGDKLYFHKYGSEVQHEDQKKTNSKLSKSEKERINSGNISSKKKKK